MSKCGLLYDPVFLKHETGAGHPEQPQRVSHAHKAIVQAKLDQKVLPLTCSPCKMEHLERAHTRQYLDQAQKEIGMGLAQLSTGDTSVCKESWEEIGRAHV